MAGLVDKFKRMWDAPDDEYEYDEYGYADESEVEPEEIYEEKPKARTEAVDYTSRRSKVVNINATAKLQVAIFKTTSEYKILAKKNKNKFKWGLNFLKSINYSPYH